MPTSGDKPTVYVIAGPNGAGKTTFATEFLPSVMKLPEFLNADLIAAGLAPFAPPSQGVRAGRLFLDRFHELVQAKQSFSFETTLAGRAHLASLRRMRDSGYHVCVFFLWLPMVEIAIARVANRVQLGGHDPEADIRRRFRRGMAHFFVDAVAIADSWALFDASQREPMLIAEGGGTDSSIHDEALYQQAHEMSLK